MNRSITRLALAAASAVAIGACSSTSHAASGTTTTTASTPPSTASTPPSTAAPTPTTAAPAPATTVAAAPADPHTLLLQLADLPSGLWKAQAHSPDPTRRTDDAYLDSCLGIPTIDDNESAVYYSDFARSDNQSFANSEVDVVKDTPYATRDFAALRGSKSAGCALSSAKEVFAEQNKTATNKFAAQSATFIQAPAPFFAVRLEATVTPAGGSPEPVVIDTYYFQAGNDEVQYGFSAIGGADSATETSTVADLAKRLGA